MGMSASQARLIQLTARMSDLELEGQQINQQRLNLANQSSAIQEEALKIPVPTAPSTYDFMREVYSGTDNNGNKVYSGTGSDGKPRFSMLEDDVKTLKANGQAGVQDKYEEVDASKVDEVAGKGREVTVTIPDIQHKKEKCNDQEALRALSGAVDSYNGSGNKGDWDLDGVDSSSITYDTTYYFTGKQTSKQVDDENRPKYGSDGTTVIGYEQKTVYPSEKEHDEVEYTNFKCSSDLWQGKYEPSTTGATKGVPVGPGESMPSLANVFGVDASKITGNFTLSVNGEEVTAEQVKDISTNGYTVENQNKICSAFRADAKGTELKAEDLFDKNGKMKQGVQLFEKSELERVDGKDAYGTDEIKSSDIYENNAGVIDELLERIKTYDLNQNTAKNISGNQNLDNYRILVKDNGDGSYSFEVALINKDAEGKRSATLFDENYNEKAYVEKEADVTINDTTGTGYATIKNADGTTQKIPLIKSQELDTDAYKAAEANYTNEKAEYDRAQEKANTQVKKLQTIDKQLELKLKRLDTERNALNTEIDAVKKVIQDNTDKSFKTFSG